MLVRLDRVAGWLWWVASYLRGTSRALVALFSWPAAGYPWSFVSSWAFLQALGRSLFVIVRWLKHWVVGDRWWVRTRRSLTQSPEESRAEPFPAKILASSQLLNSEYNTTWPENCYSSKSSKGSKSLTSKVAAPPDLWLFCQITVASKWTIIFRRCREVNPPKTCNNYLLVRLCLDLLQFGSFSFSLPWIFGYVGGTQRAALDW